jgi:hypothetical protein
MKDENLTRTPFVVRDERTAAFLNEESKARLLFPFVARETSLAQAASEVGVKLNVMGYWVKRLLEMGLIEMTRLEPRHGSPIRHYRSVTDQIIVPVALMPSVSDEELLMRRVDWHMRTFQRSAALQGRKLYPDWHLRFYRNEGGRITWAFEPSIAPGQAPVESPPGLDMWGQFWLSAEEAAELHRTLEDTIRRLLPISAARKAVGGTPHYMVHVGLVEIVDTSDA